MLENEVFMSAGSWRKLRVDFVQLIELVYSIDSWLSFLILICLGHNMLIIVLKIFNAFQWVDSLKFDEFSVIVYPFNRYERHNAITEVYFWFFLIYFIVRTLYMLIVISQINDTVKKPLEIIRNIPTKYWNVDVSENLSKNFWCQWIIYNLQLKRLHDTILIVSPTLTFSGLKFFYITKDLILGVSLNILMVLNLIETLFVLLKFLATVVTYELFLLDDIDKEKESSICDTIPT